MLRRFGRVDFHKTTNCFFKRISHYLASVTWQVKTKELAAEAKKAAEEVEKAKELEEIVEKEKALANSSSRNEGIPIKALGYVHKVCVTGT